ncbi:hypothetical protein [Methylomonas albis]|nr:hypothetical protein [Methylomonas albis]
MQSAPTAAGCHCQSIVVGGRTPKALAEFGWINTASDNLKTSFDFVKYDIRYLAAFVYRFNRASTWQLDLCVYSLPPSISGPAN